MKKVWLTTVGDLEAFLKKEIAAGRNPSTKKQWAEFFERMAAEKAGVENVGEIEDNVTAGYLAGSMRDEGINARVMKAEKPNAD